MHGAGVTIVEKKWGELGELGRFVQEACWNASIACITVLPQYLLHCTGVVAEQPKYIAVQGSCDSRAGRRRLNNPDVLEDLFNKQSRRIKTAKEKLNASAGHDHN